MFNSRILRLPEIKEKTGVPTSTIYAWMKSGMFPQGIKLGARSVGWLESDLEAWLQERIDATKSLK